MPLSNAARQARWRARNPDARKASRKASRRTDQGKATRYQAEQRRTRKRSASRPFMAIDGEGCGTDDKGRQLYMLLCAGDRELFTGEHLGTAECLDFICDLPADPILVGFSFGYDTTMILRDLPPDRRERLLAPREAGEGKSRYTYWGNFGIEYLPRNYLRICRTKTVVWTEPDGTRKVSKRRVEGTTRTIYEVFGFFQMSFLKAIRAFDVGHGEWERIERNKAERGTFVRITDEIRHYCAAECALLAEMMEKFRAICAEANIIPRTWNGAGKLASALHEAHETITAARIRETVPAGAVGMARAAYYGGRFEVTHVGDIPGPVYEHDIRSAYPAMMAGLPCLEHGEWEPAPARWLRSAPSDALFVAACSFTHPAPAGAPRRTLCGLPIRLKTGRLCWPSAGSGVYWSAEIRSAERLGAVVTYRDRPNGAAGEAAGWRYVCKCECRQFDWVNRLYEYRRSIGASLAGYPIKLGINSLYGKLAQRIGNPRWANMIWAGLITAGTRAALNDAAAAAGPGGAGVVMLATDGMFSTVPLPVTIGEALGQWEAATHPHLFVVQPGIYWGAKRPKTRGVPEGLFAAHTGLFEAAWSAYAETDRAAARAEAPAPPVVTLPLTLFVGLKLAQARGKPDTAGVWKQQDRHFKFDWSGKRGRHGWLTDRCAWTYPLTGDVNQWSVAHASDRALLDQMDIDKAELDEQQDYVDLTPPWRD